MLLSCEKMINGFAIRLARECSALDYEDLRSDFWIVALEAMKQWKGDMNNKFSTFLYQKLVWKRIDILSAIIRHDGKASIIDSSGGDFVVGGPRTITQPVERSLDTLCGEVSARLGVDERRLFRLMVDPSSLSEVKAKSNKQSLFFKLRKDRVCYYHYGMFLGWNRGKVDKAVKMIKIAVEEVVNG